MENQNKGNLEKYKASDWGKLSRRAIGPRGHRASKIKRRMVQHIRSRDDLTPSAKMVGAILVDWYNEGRGYSWPSRSILAAEVGLTERSVQRATGELHELGVIHKATGGGWDKGKVRHKANLYYPAFSLVLESAENGGNLRKYRDNMSPETNCLPLKGENRRNTAEVPGQNVSPYGDKHMANANASAIPPCGSLPSLAPAEGPGGWTRVYWVSPDELAERLDVSPFELVEGFKPGGDEIMRGILLAALADDFTACNARRTFEVECETYEAIISIHAQEGKVESVSILDGHELNKDTTFRVEYWN